MTPKACLERLKKNHPDLVFNDTYFKHDGWLMFFGHPKESNPGVVIGNVFAVDPKTGVAQPFAPYGNGLDEFHRWYESSLHQIHL